LLAWAKARDFRDRATEYLDRSRTATGGSVQTRFIDIARHYQMLAVAEANKADQLGSERRGQADTPQNGSLHWSSEIEALRSKLQTFASQQTNQTVRSQCLAVDAKLAEALEGDDPILRHTLTSSIEQLEEALRHNHR
jgi:hypothetical protein